MQTTTNIGLKTYEANDPTDWLGEFNYNMNKIDTAVGSQNDAIEVIEETASTAVTTANTANTTAGEALTTAEGKASINDNVASATTTYSSNKINNLISGAGEAVIDDTETSATKTWSSNKINTEISNKPSIDDTTASGTSVYSSNKVNSELSGKQNTITGGASTVTSTNLTASKALISDSNGKISTSSITSTQLGYLSGATGNIQNQINSINSYSTTQATLLTGNADYKVLHKIDHVVQFDFEYNGVADSSSPVMTIPTGYRPIENLNVPVLSINYAHMYALIKTTGEVYIGGVQSVGASETVHGNIVWITSTI